MYSEADKVIIEACTEKGWRGDKIVKDKVVKHITEYWVQIRIHDIRRSISS